MKNRGMMTASYWDKEYEQNMRIWGDRPGELAVIAVKYMQNQEPDDTCHSILDIGCGYGRDSVFLASNLNCSIVGIDKSRKAIEISNGSLADPSTAEVQFKYCDFAELGGDEFDIVFVSNMYHLLKKQQRKALRNKIADILKPGGLLFLNTLSVNDPEEYGKGKTCPGERHSFEGEKFLHFSTRDELELEFNFISIKQLYEHEYTEFRKEGRPHHHVSWILIGERPGPA